MNICANFQYHLKIARSSPSLPGTVVKRRKYSVCHSHTILRPLVMHEIGLNGVPQLRTDNFGTIIIRKNT